MNLVATTMLLMVMGINSFIEAEPDRIFSDLDENSLTDPEQLSFEEEPPRVESVAEGNPLKLGCAVTAIPPASIVWLKNGVQISGSESQQRNQVEKLSNFGRKTVQMATTKSELSLECVDKTRQGVYSCVGDNGYQKIVTNTSVKLAESNAVQPSLCGQKKRAKARVPRPSPAHITVWTDIRMELTGSSAQLFCRAEGYPVPEITWYLYENVEDEENLGGKVKLEADENHLLLGNGDLLVKSAPGSTGASYYECEATNVLGSDSRIMLIVTMD